MQHFRHAIAAFSLVLAAVLPGAVSPVLAQAEAEQRSAEIGGWVYETSWELEGVPEPSGLCFHPERGTLYIVDDGHFGRPAALFEISLDCEVISKLELGLDLEGVCYCPVDGLMYVCDEYGEKIYAVDPEAMTLEAEYLVSRSFEGSEVLEEGGNGFEGIEFIPEGESGYFMLVNQDDPHALMRIDYANLTSTAPGDSCEADGFWTLPEVNCGELHYDAGNNELWVVNSWMNTMQVYSLPDVQLLRWEVIPGAAQEAVAEDAKGRIYIGYDLGGVARYSIEE